MPSTGGSPYRARARSTADRTTPSARESPLAACLWLQHQAATDQGLTVQLRLCLARSGRPLGMADKYDPSPRDCRGRATRQRQRQLVAAGYGTNAHSRAKLRHEAQAIRLPLSASFYLYQTGKRFELGLLLEPEINIKKLVISTTSHSSSLTESKRRMAWHGLSKMIVQVLVNLKSDNRRCDCCKPLSLQPVYETRHVRCSVSPFHLCFCRELSQCPSLRMQQACLQRFVLSHCAGRA